MEQVRFGGIVLHTSKLERLRAFYQTLLGASFDKEKHGKGPEHYALQNNGIVMELYPGEKQADRSVGLSFYTSNLKAIKLRMQQSVNEPIADHQDNTLTFPDPDQRNIHLRETGNGQIKVGLEEVIVHTPETDKQRSFYERLLGVTFQEKISRHQLPPEYGKSYLHSQDGLTLRLYPDERRVAPEPGLLFYTDDLLLTMERMRPHAELKLERNGFRMLDHDKRKIHVYQKD